MPVDPPKNDNEKPMSCVSCQVIEVAPGPRELVPEASSKILTMCLRNIQMITGPHSDIVAAFCPAFVFSARC